METNEKNQIVPTANDITVVELNGKDNSFDKAELQTVISPQTYELTEADKADAKELLDKTSALELHAEKENITGKLLLQYADEIDNLLDTLDRNYSTKKVGLVFLTKFNKDFAQYKDDPKFIKYLYGAISNNKNLNLTIVDDLMVKILSTKSFNLDSNNYELIIDTIKYNASNKSLETCVQAINSILNISSNKKILFISTKDKDVKIQNKKGHAIGLVLDAMNDIILNFICENNFNAINNSLGIIYTALKNIHDAEDKNDIIFEHWKSDKLLTTIASATISLKNMSNKPDVLMRYFNDDYKFTQLFRLLVSFHSSYDLKHYLVNYSELIGCFSFDTVRELLNNKNYEMTGIKANCIDYMCKVYNIEHLKHFRNEIEYTIRDFILNSAEDTILRMDTFNRFIGNISHENEKKEFIEKVIFKYFDDELHISKYSECIMCRDDYTASIDFAINMYTLLKPISSLDYGDTKLQLQTRLENKIYNSNSTVSKRTRDEFYELITKELQTKKELVDYSKECINKIINTSKSVHYDSIFKKDISTSESIKYELRINQFFSKVSASVAKEFSDLKSFFHDNIEKNIYNNISEISNEKRAAYFEIETENMENIQIIDYTKNIMTKLIAYRSNENVGCIFCDDKKSIEKMPRFVLSLYNTLVANASVLSVPEKIISDLSLQLKTLMLEIPDSDIELRKNIFTSLTKNMPIDEFVNFSNDFIKRLINFQST